MHDKLTHSCLIRHRRTHERSDGSEGPYGSFSGEEEEYEGEDQLGSLEEASPNSENGYLPGTMPMAAGHNGMGGGGGNPYSMASMGMGNGMGMVSRGMAAPSQLITAQHLMQQPI